MTRKELWDLSDAEFNKWRRDNDLNVLFQQFNDSLPLFKEWLLDNKLTVGFILNTDKPGAFFYGDKETLLIEYKDVEDNPYLFIPIHDKNHEKELTSISKTDKATTKKYKFKPYLIWAKEKLPRGGVAVPYLVLNTEFLLGSYVVFSNRTFPFYWNHRSGTVEDSHLTSLNTNYYIFKCSRIIHLL